jgi:formylglycine-generating enzyme required for sulfatase activity
LLTIPINYRFGPLPNVGISGATLDKCICSVSVTPASDWTIQFQPGSGQTSPYPGSLSFPISGDQRMNQAALQVTPANAGVSTGQLTLTASSWVFPNIQDQVTIQLEVAPAGMTLIPAGAFTMGDTLDGESDAIPVSVTVSAFYMDVNLVSYSQWQSVYAYATSHGYGFDNAGSGEAANHPVQTVNWYDVVKWSNARSQQAGLTPVYYIDAGLTQVYMNGDAGAVYPNWSASGYRLPTEAEWEKAARGGGERATVSVGRHDF